MGLTERMASCYRKRMKKVHTLKYLMKEERDTDFVPGAPAARIALVWPLTREVASLSKRHNVKQRLQRHITRLERREG